MKRKFLILVAILAVACWVAPAWAFTTTIPTPTGATENGGNAVDASATITTFSNGDVTITLQNLEANPLTVAQCLSDFGFVLTSGAGGNLSSSSGQEINVASNGTFTLGGTVATGWVLSNPTGSSFLLDVLGTATAPTHTIIGPPDGTYSNANPSIAGNDPHNPFLNQSATFNLNIPGVTADTRVASVTFSFGTTPGDNVNVVPIPPTALLLGSGLLGLGLISWRRKRD